MNKKKTLLATILVAILLTASIGGTLAWLEDRSGPVVNQFTPSELDTELVDTMNGNKKTVIAVENVNDPKHIPAYVRVMIVGNWYDENDKIVAPWTDTVDYDKNNWTYNGEYYYYNHVLPVGETTPNLLASPIEATANNGYHLEIMVVHQSIQAEGMGAITAQQAFAMAETIN